MPERADFASAEEYNQAVAEEFRANHGTLIGRPSDLEFLLVTTTGAKSGAARMTPLVYTTDAGRFIVCASDGGNEHHPGWFHNLVANRTAHVEAAGESVVVRAAIADEVERERLMGRPTRQSAILAEHQTKTGRQIPVVILQRSE